MNARVRSLQDLKTLHETMRRREAEAQRREAEQREQAARERRERELFARTVGQVVPLRRASRAQHATPRPAPEPVQRLRDEAAALQQSFSDEFDVDTLIETDEGLSFRRPGLAPEVVRKLRRGVWAIQAHLDLHGLRRDAAREQLSAFLRGAEAEGMRCVRIVHGKGLGSPGRQPVLKGKVRSWLVQSSQVIAFAQARPADGGNGAIVALLRPARRHRPTALSAD